MYVLYEFRGCMGEQRWVGESVTPTGDYWS